MYLNTPESGGSTIFPDIGLEVLPVKGNAVFFSYDRAHPSTRTLHGGSPCWPARNGWRPSGCARACSTEPRAQRRSGSKLCFSARSTKLLLLWRMPGIL